MSKQLRSGPLPRFLPFERLYRHHIGSFVRSKFFTRAEVRRFHVDPLHDSLEQILPLIEKRDRILHPLCSHIQTTQSRDVGYQRAELEFGQVHTLHQVRISQLKKLKLGQRLMRSSDFLFDKSPVRQILFELNTGRQTHRDPFRNSDENRLENAAVARSCRDLGRHSGIFVLQVDVHESKQDCRYGSQRLSPSSPFSFRHAHRPPVDPEKAVLGGSRVHHSVLVSCGWHGSHHQSKVDRRAVA